MMDSSSRPIYFASVLTAKYFLYLSKQKIF